MTAPHSLASSKVPFATPHPTLHTPQVVRELEVGRDRIQEELLVTAQLVTQLEARLSDALGRIDAAETATGLAEGRARCEHVWHRG